MPNWCSNFLYLTQDNPSLLKAFTDLPQDHVDGNQIPGIKMDRWFHEIHVEDGSIRFDTRWGPEIEEMEKIALFFKTDFECEYEEYMMGIYGKIIYKDGIFTDYELDQTEIGKIDFELDENGDDDDCGPVTLDGEEYQHYRDAIDELINRKIKKATDAHTNQITEKNG